MFLPTSRSEMKALGWDELDIILVSGDAYIDSPLMGISVIGKLLLREGYRVGIIPQPDVESDDILRMGRPKLFWGVSGGSVDSMLSNYTATKKRRNKDDYTPGGINNRRPDRAVIVYSTLIKRKAGKESCVVLGGIEASLRRVVHYDYWNNKLRRSILIDAQADYLVYGMGERTIVELAAALKAEGDAEDKPKAIRGLCYLDREVPQNYLTLPDYESCLADKHAFIEMFDNFYHNMDPITALGLAQKQDSRYLIQNRPAQLLSKEEMDDLASLEFELDVHPRHKKEGVVKALETIKFSILTHRGCYGECNFCAITVHQGKTIQSRSQESIIAEAKALSQSKGFKGYINDVGGPTANMYDYECQKKLTKGSCEDRRCVDPQTCKSLKVNHQPQIKLLRALRGIKAIKKVFVASGIRYDLVADDKKHGQEFLREIVENHTSGQLKIAPEHCDDKVLALMGKPDKQALMDFVNNFKAANQKSGKKQFLTYYMIAAHPGCSEKEMAQLKKYSQDKLGLNPEQVQIFTPTPSTYSTLMYYTEINPFTGEKIFVEKDIRKKEKQKDLVTRKTGGVQQRPANRNRKSGPKAHNKRHR